MSCQNNILTNVILQKILAKHSLTHTSFMFFPSKDLSFSFIYLSLFAFETVRSVTTALPYSSPLPSITSITWTAAPKMNRHHSQL